MIKEELVSIITPIYNSQNTIGRVYESIKKQSYINWEWIVIDDCSIDQSFKIISSFSKDDSRVRVFKTEKNSGAAIARNLGISKANGKFIAFIDSDDIWKDNKLTEQINFMKTNDYSFTFSNIDVLHKGKLKNKKIRKSVITYKDLLKKNYIPCLTAIYDSEKLGYIFMPVDAPKREDHAMWLDITKKGIKCYKINKILATYCLNDNSVSSNKFKMVKYQYILYRKHEHFNIFKSYYYLFCCCFKKILSYIFG